MIKKSVNRIFIKICIKALFMLFFVSAALRRVFSNGITAYDFFWNL